MFLLLKVSKYTFRASNAFIFSFRVNPMSEGCIVQEKNRKSPKLSPFKKMEEKRS